MDGSSPNSDFNFFLKFCVFFRVFVLFSCFKMFPKKLKKMDNGVGGWDPTNPSFSRIFGIILT